MWYNCDYTDDWTFVENWEEDKKDGDTTWLAFLFGDSNEVMKELILDFIKKEPDVLTKKLVAIREKRNIPTRIDVSRKYFSKILKK